MPILPSTSSWRRVLPIGVTLLVLGGVGAVAALRHRSRQTTTTSHLPAFEAFQERLRTFTTLRAAVRYNLANSTGLGSSDHCLFFADPRQGGQLSLELIRGGLYRYTWVGGVLRRHLTGWATPEPLPAFAPLVSEIWTEARSGFARSTVYEDDPRDHGLYVRTGTTSEMVRVDLPFAWARDVLVFLLMSREDDNPHEIIVSGARRAYYIPIDQVDWNFPLTEAVFDPYASTLAPPNPECWRVQGAH